MEEHSTGLLRPRQFCEDCVTYTQTLTDARSMVWLATQRGKHEVKILQYLIVQTQGQAIALASLATEGRTALSGGTLLDQSDLAGNAQAWQGADVPKAQCRQMAALVCGPLIWRDVYAHITMRFVVLQPRVRACCYWLTTFCSWLAA